MIGRVIEEDGQKVIQTLAGATAGTVCKVAYDGNQNYPLLGTRDELGEGYTGLLDWTDETDPESPVLHKGPYYNPRTQTLTVEHICSCGGVAEGSDTLKANSVNLDQNYNLAFWDSTSDGCYCQMDFSGGRSITYNPYSATLTSVNSCVTGTSCVLNLCVANPVVQGGTLAYDSQTFNIRNLTTRCGITMACNGLIDICCNCVTNVCQISTDYIIFNGHVAPGTGYTVIYDCASKSLCPICKMCWDGSDDRLCVTGAITVDCGIDTYYDINMYCEPGGSVTGYIYCDSSFCLGSTDNDSTLKGTICSTDCFYGNVIETTGQICSCGSCAQSTWAQGNNSPAFYATNGNTGCAAGSSYNAGFGQNVNGINWSIGSLSGCSDWIMVCNGNPLYCFTDSGLYYCGSKIEAGGTACYLSLCGNCSSVYVTASNNNEFNMYNATGSTFWINYRGGSKVVKFGDGNGTGAVGTVCAGNLYATYYFGGLGATAYRSSATWGSQTGTVVYGIDDCTGGSMVFRRDNPNSGQMSMVIDGTVYTCEGQYRVLNTADLAGCGVCQFSISGNTLIITSR